MTEVFNRTTQKPVRRMLRKSMPKAEIMLWSRIRRKQIHGQRFRRQYSVESFVVDFYSPALKLAIEIDGDSHTDKTRNFDLERQSAIESYGISFLRFTNEDIYENLDGVVDVIYETIERLTEKG
ncbi:MAG: DUF559 domain-containing protein [Ignavibacteriales bacterium]|nr:DUF559 domain-containing protein [Ignavibacteriales bacterium]